MHWLLWPPTVGLGEQCVAVLCQQQGNKHCARERHKYSTCGRSDMHDAVDIVSLSFECVGMYH